MATMPIESLAPDMTASLRLDVYAPRAARHRVAQVDRPAPDLRDAIVLLTSEMVTRAVEHCRSDADEVELRAWMPHDVVRVELRAPPELLRPPEEGEWPSYDVVLLGQVADRWSIDIDEDLACMWFEIDRQAPKAEPKPDPRRRVAPRRRSLIGRPRRSPR
jgi:hypothetical protein